MPITIQTQENAQQALPVLDSAMLRKDQIRAHLGALQNRLENTVSNLQIHAENIQAAESRISDVDVASAMTEFVRSQILADTAISMLAQANSLPQMALSLIGEHRAFPQSILFFHTSLVARRRYRLSRRCCFIGGQ